jgi:hypothetical protein
MTMGTGGAPGQEGQAQQQEAQRQQAEAQRQQQMQARQQEALRQRDAQAQEARARQQAEAQRQQQMRARQQEEAKRQQEAEAQPPARAEGGRQPAGETRRPERVPGQGRSQAPGAQVLGASPVTTGDDLAIEAPHMNVEDFSLEVQANVGVERVNISAKSMDVEFYLRANLDNALGVVEATRRDTSQAVSQSGGAERREQPRQVGQGQERRGQQQGQAQQQGQGEGGESSRGTRLDVARAIETARTAYERAAPELRGELQEAYDTLRNAYQKVVGETRQDGGEAGQRSGDEAVQDGGGLSAGARAKQIARSPGAAAVAGAVAAFAGSRAHLPTRRHPIRDHLPGRKHSATGDLVNRATEVPGDVARTVRRRLG